MKERFRYRLQKWLFQQVTGNRGGTQLQRLEATDWDVLVVLDACRPDVLREVTSWPVETVVSPASCTPEWLEVTCAEGLFEGGHVLTGNPQYEDVASRTGAATIEHHWRTSWNDRLQTTLPEPILDRTSELLETDSAPVIAHLQQPHWPYVARLDGDWELAYDDLGPWPARGGSEEIVSLQVAMERGHIDTSLAYSAYRAATESIWETLVPYLSRWLDEGKTAVVTADHGETFGRLRDVGFYEHPCGCHIDPLTTVPWVELAPTTATAADGVEERLEALGYA